MIVDVASSALKQSDPHDGILYAPTSGEPLPVTQVSVHWRLAFKEGVWRFGYRVGVEGSGLLAY